MTDRETHDGDWIAAWIARQREALSHTSRDQARDADGAGLAKRWAESGQTFLDGLKQFANAAGIAGGGPAMDPFNISEGLLGAWTSATYYQSTIAEQASEFLRRLPPIGLAREQTEAWRELAAAQAECKRLEHELRSVLAKVQFDALDLLEQRVRAADEPIDTFRELYDLWVLCGEQVYSKLAHSDAYSKLQAEMGNATMRLRARVQTILEHALKQLDLPTRSELNSVHRQLRDLRMELDLRTASAPARKPRSAKRPAVKPKKRKVPAR